MHIRRAAPSDADEIARIHVAGWHQTYKGLLPAEYLSGLSADRRAESWRALLADGAVVHLAPGRGFVSFGPQRDSGLVRDWPDELHAIYVLRPQQGLGLGRSLLRAALGEHPRPFSAFVLEGNDAAHRFYLKTGATELFRRPDTIGGHPIIDIALGWPNPLTV